jgi:hypothetical protein
MEERCATNAPRVGLASWLTYRASARQSLKRQPHVDRHRPRTVRAWLTIKRDPGLPRLPGANADGGVGDAQRAFPALRAQQVDFIEQWLKDYRAGKLQASTNDMIVTGVAATLDDMAITDLAQCLSSLPAN